MCSPGYFGYLCKAKCVYPYYGEECKGHCDCSENLCDVTNGCQPVTEGVFYTNYNCLNSRIIDTDFLNMSILVFLYHVFYRRNYYVYYQSSNADIKTVSLGVSCSYNFKHRRASIWMKYFRAGHKIIYL